MEVFIVLNRVFIGLCEPSFILWMMKSVMAECYSSSQYSGTFDQSFLLMLFLLLRASVTTFLNPSWSYRWRSCGWAGASCSSWTRPSPLCPYTWLLCWRLQASTRRPCLPSAWCPSWTRSGFSRTRWTSWTGCRWTRPSTAASKPLHSSHLVSSATGFYCHLSPEKPL